LSSERLNLGCRAARLSAVRVVEPAGAGGLDQALAHLLAEKRAAGAAEGAAKERERAARALDAAVLNLEAQRLEASEALAQTAVGLAVEIARELMAVELEAGRHNVERIVREALAAAGGGRGEFTVHLNPADAAALAGVPFRSGTRVAADPGIARGEVQVQTPSGLLVRDLEDALAEIRRRILSSLRSTS
jgi:flagellar biosynthesis/type III secretory pathway protein FliH